MANIKSQIKRNRQNDKRRLRNRIYRGAARTAVKNAHSAIMAGDPEVSKQVLLDAISKLDRAAEKGVIHKNNAARRKSRLMKQFAKMEPVAVKTVAEPVIEEPVVEAKPRQASGRSRKPVKEPEAEAKPRTETKTKAAAKPKAEAKSKPKTESKTKAASATISKAKKPAEKKAKK